MGGKKHTDKTSAESKSIGFEYQYYFFLWQLLSLKPNQSVGLEVKDDVHTELSNDVHIYYQLKHTIEIKSDGSPANLRASDVDLWKTLSNWAKVITDKNDKRSNISDQVKFLEKSYFILASNKSSNEGNIILSTIKKLKNKKNNVKTLKIKFKTFASNSDSDSLKKHVDDVIKLDDNVLFLFLNQTTFELDEDDIINKCKDEIRAKMVPETKVEEVFKQIDSSIREDNFIDIKNRKKIIIKFNDFRLKYRKYFNLSRTNLLKSKKFQVQLPDKIEDQIFIQQLLEIEDFDKSDLEIMVEYTKFKLNLINNLVAWHQNGELTSNEMEKYHEEAINQWKNEFRKNYRGNITENEFNKKGLGILDSMRQVKLILSDQQMGTDLSNGEFYYLSDRPSIGWRKDWEKHKK